MFWDVLGITVYSILFVLRREEPYLLSSHLFPNHFDGPKSDPVRAVVGRGAPRQGQVHHPIGVGLGELSFPIYMFCNHENV